MKLLLEMSNFQTELLTSSVNQTRPLELSAAIPQLRSVVFWAWGSFYSRIVELRGFTTASASSDPRVNHTFPDESVVIALGSEFGFRSYSVIYFED